MSQSFRDCEPSTVAYVPCTACGGAIYHNLRRPPLFRHQALDVLVCKRCLDFYGSGKWTRDENGQDEYCRWCGEGGNLYICCNEKCLSGFCDKCIKRNFGSKECKKVDNDDDWRCYICDPENLKEIQEWTASVFKFAEDAKEERRSAANGERKFSANEEREFAANDEPQYTEAEERQSTAARVTGKSKEKGSALLRRRSSLFDLREAIRKALDDDGDPAVGREQVQTLWNDLKTRVASLEAAVEDSDLDRAAELVESLIESVSASPPVSTSSSPLPPVALPVEPSSAEPSDLSPLPAATSPPPPASSPSPSAAPSSPSAAPSSPSAASSSSDSPSPEPAVAAPASSSRESSPSEELEEEPSSAESVVDPRERVERKVKAALKKLVEVSRAGTTPSKSKPDAPVRDSPFRDSDEETEEDDSTNDPRRKRRTETSPPDSEAACDADPVQVKSEPAEEEEMQEDEIDEGGDPGDRPRLAPVSDEAAEQEAEPEATDPDDKIIWEGLRIRDFISNGVEVRIKRLEVVVNEKEALVSKATKRLRSEGEESAEEDTELLKLLRNPISRRRLRRSLRNVAEKRAPDLKKSESRKTRRSIRSNSESSDVDSEDDRGRSPEADSDSSRGSPDCSRDDQLFIKTSSESDHTMPRRLSSDSESDIQVIAEVKRPRKRKSKQEVVFDSDEEDRTKENGDDDGDTEEDPSPRVKRAIPALVKADSQASKRKRAKKDCDTEAGTSKTREGKRRKIRIIDTDDEESKEDKVLEELSPLVSDSGSELEEPEQPKRKRKSKKKRAVIGGSDSDEDQNDTEKRRKGIRKIISDDKVEKESRAAAKEEAERRKRVLERQKLYNEIEEAMQKERKTDKVTRCVLEYDATTKEPVVEVDEALVRSMKPHQVEGVKFLYNTVIESVEQVTNGKPGGGAILAHCMGLGKTFQAICFLHTLLTHKVLNQHIRKIIVVCPCNVVLNWAREFEMWVEENNDVKGSIPLFEFSRAKNLCDRLGMLEDWYQNGGVLIIGYSMFRTMSQNKTKSRKIRDRLPKMLHDPGADLVICDEGHTLKSDKAQISKAMNLIKTQRRVILTGTPLQNNMSEYHCMVSFVKPNLLGTTKEFANRFMNPISFGQEANATSYHVKMMKKRVHILNKLLAGCVHRCDYSHLTPYLPAKFEYIISIELSVLQKKLYGEYLKHIGITEETTREDLRGRSLLKDYQVLKMIWSHPYLLMESEDRQEDRRQKEAYKNQLDEFVVDGSEDESVPSQSGSGTSDYEVGSGDEELVKTYKTRRNRRENPDAESEPEEDNSKKRYDKTWWITHVPEDEEDFIQLELSSKLLLAFEILRECELIGDKVILFSTSLLTLSLFERNLQMQYEKSERENAGGDYINSWVHGLDYFRLDGSTSVDARKRYIDQFNDTSNLRARLFLVSTKAGGIGANMVGANRIIVIDASWNPSDDTQAIFRAYRYGQAKPVYVYRLLAHATMEEKIYDRQVNKISLASRVVDEQNLERHFNESDLKALYEFKPEKDARKTPAVPKDRLLAELLIKQKTLIQGYHEHDSLLQKELEDELTEEERKLAWKEYEDERDGKAPPPSQGLYNGMPGMYYGGQVYVDAHSNGVQGMPGYMPGFHNAYQQGASAYLPRPQVHAMPGTSGQNLLSHLTAEQAKQFAAYCARLQSNPAMYANLHNQFIRPSHRPPTNVNPQQRTQHIPQALSHSMTREQLLNRAPFFETQTNHPSLNPKRILDEIKLKYVQADQFELAHYFKEALKKKLEFYSNGLLRANQGIDRMRSQGVGPTRELVALHNECKTAVDLCRGLVSGLEKSIEEARTTIQRQKSGGSSRPPVIDLDSPSAGRERSGRTGPIIEEID